MAVLALLVAIAGITSAFCHVVEAIATAAPQYVDVPLEHAFGSSAFKKTGQINGDFSLEAVQGGAAVELERDEWSAAEQSSFAALVAADDFYRIRVPVWKGEFAVSSVRARCLQAADFKETISLALTSNGSVSGLQYSTPIRSCQPGLTKLPPASGRNDPVGPSVHNPLSIALDVSRVAKPVAMMPLDHATSAATAQPLPPWLLGDQQEERLKQYQAQQQRQQQQQKQQQQQRSSSGSGSAQPASTQQVGSKQSDQANETKGEPVAPPEKSFIQQNWFFLIPIGLVVYNSLGRIMPDPQ